MKSRAAKKPRTDRPRGGRIDVDKIDLGDLAVHAGTYMRMFSQVLNHAVDEMMEGHPIGPGLGKTSSLQVIVRNPGISQIELSAIFGRDRSAQFRTTQLLEERGLIYRKTDPGERRRQMLFATEKGKALVAGLEEMAHRNEARVFSALTPSQYATFRRLLAILWKSTLSEGKRYWPDFTS